MPHGAVLAALDWSAGKIKLISLPVTRNNDAESGTHRPMIYHYYPGGQHVVCVCVCVWRVFSVLLTMLSVSNLALLNAFVTSPRLKHSCSGAQGLHLQPQTHAAGKAPKKVKSAETKKRIKAAADKKAEDARKAAAAKAEEAAKKSAETKAKAAESDDESEDSDDSGESDVRQSTGADYISRLSVTCSREIRAVASRTVPVKLQL